jgi:hypothetical protein
LTPDLKYLDQSQARGNVTGVRLCMGDVIVEEKTVLDNVRLGMEDATGLP